MNWTYLDSGSVRPYKDKVEEFLAVVNYLAENPQLGWSIEGPGADEFWHIHREDNVWTKTDDDILVQRLAKTCYGTLRMSMAGAGEWTWRLHGYKVHEGLTALETTLV